MTDPLIVKSYSVLPVFFTVASYTEEHLLVTSPKGKTIGWFHRCEVDALVDAKLVVQYKPNLRGKARAKHPDLFWRFASAGAVKEYMERT